jgi:hypothetical protein
MRLRFLRSVKVKHACCHEGGIRLSMEAVRQITAPSPHSNILSTLPHLARTSTTRQHQKSLHNEDPRFLLRPVCRYQLGLRSSNPRQDSRQASATSDGHRRSDPPRSIPRLALHQRVSIHNYDDSNDEDKTARTTIHNACKDWPAMMQKALESIANTDDTTFNRRLAPGRRRRTQQGQPHRRPRLCQWSLPPTAAGVYHLSSSQGSHQKLRERQE